LQEGIIVAVRVAADKILTIIPIDASLMAATLPSADSTLGAVHDQTARLAKGSSLNLESAVRQDCRVGAAGDGQCAENDRGRHCLDNHIHYFPLNLQHTDP